MGEIAAATGESVGAHLSRLLAERGSAPDDAQRRALARLEHLAAELPAFRTARQSRLKRLIAPPAVPRGVYLWGGVGRGKSLLMDAFYATVHLRRKTRVHFHAFMRDVHGELARLSREADPLATVAERIAKRHRLVCFDEFDVSDIADAMILGRLLKSLFAHVVVFVLTSNYPPEGLYPNGLQRQNFLPTIDLMREWLVVHEVDGGTDYRLRALEQVPVYHEVTLDSTYEIPVPGSPEMNIPGISGHCDQACSICRGHQRSAATSAPGKLEEASIRTVPDFDDPVPSLR